jgi:phage terminase large subunit-like protein
VTEPTIQACARNPAAFRSKLKIDASGKTVPFHPDRWQQDDFDAMDAAWLYAIGRGPKPPVTRSWQERPRGHAKSSDLGTSLAWALFAAPQAVKGLAAAGDKDQAGILRDSIATLARCNPWLRPILDVQRNCVVNKKTGSQLDVISSDVATSWGALVDFAACDEISHWKNEDLFVSILSTVAKRSNAILACILNAGFTESFCWKLREQVRVDPGWHFSHVAGSQASWISADALAEQKRLLPPLAFCRLWLNEWTSGAGDALQEADIQASLTLEGPTLEAEPDYRYFAGLDLSVSRDTSAFVIIGRHRSGLIKLVAIYAWIPKPGTKVNLDLVRVTVKEASVRYPGLLVAFDIYQAELMRQQLNRQGVAMVEVGFSGKAAMEMASELIESFASHRIALYDDVELLADLRRLRIIERPGGWRLDAPRTASNHCDRGIGLAMALWGSRSSKYDNEPDFEPFVLAPRYGWNSFLQGRRY